VRRGARPSLQVSEAITARPFAPLAQAQPVGELTVSLDGRPLVAVPLLAARAVDRAGVVARVWGYMRYQAVRLFHRHPDVSHGVYAPSV